MGIPVGLDNCLGLIYVSAWSVSMYTPVITNYRCRSSAAVSVDFVMLNIVGYMYLTCSMYLQLYTWLPISNELNKLDNVSNKEYIPKPKITDFDLFYTLHGLVLNVVLVTQVYFPDLWKFKVEKKAIMKRAYNSILITTLIIYSIITLHFVYFNDVLGWSNVRTLSYCNKLFALKLVMSLVKYLPQVKHNYDRKSMRGFSVSGVILDSVGGIASLAQLILQLYYDEGFSFSSFIVNFGKIGLGLVTLLFDFIFLTQCSIYKNSESINNNAFELAEKPQIEDAKLK